MIDRATASARRRGVANVEFRLGTAEALPVPAASVDVAVSNCVLNLVPDKAMAFQELARVVRPGGRLALADIVADRLPAEIRANRDAWCACVGGAIAESVYCELLRRAGFDGVSVVSSAPRESGAGTDGASVRSIVVTATRRDPRRRSAVHVA